MLIHRSLAARVSGRRGDAVNSGGHDGSGRDRRSGGRVIASTMLAMALVAGGTVVVAQPASARPFDCQSQITAAKKRMAWWDMRAAAWGRLAATEFSLNGSTSLYYEYTRNAQISHNTGTQILSDAIMSC